MPLSAKGKKRIKPKITPKKIFWINGKNGMIICAKCKLEYSCKCQSIYDTYSLM